MGLIIEFFNVVMQKMKESILFLMKELTRLFSNPKEEFPKLIDQVKSLEFRLTLQKKYTIVFSIIIVSILTYTIVSLYTSERRDLIKLSQEKFETIFTTINTIGEEALSVGKDDQIALKTILSDLFKKDVLGLEQVFFVDKNKSYYAYADHVSTVKSDETIPDSMWTFLEANYKTGFEKDNSVYLIKKINYKIVDRDIFLGYSLLKYSNAHIFKMIDEKRSDTIFLGIISFLLSLFILIIVTFFLTKRIKLLREATVQLTDGNFPQVDVYGNDEISDLTKSFNHMSSAVKERFMMSKYISDSTIQQIKTETSNDLNLGGLKENVCVFFSDIRGFTAFSENNDPQTVVHHLNHLLDLQVDIIKKYSGDIDKFVGDEIMAVYRGDKKEDNAILSAIEIQKEIKKLYDKDALYTQLKIGIGINTGEVVSGNIGSKNRMDFTLIGDAVNTGARLCSAAAGDEIIISDTVKPHVKEKIKFSKPFSLDLKNKSNAFKQYRVLYA